MNLTTEELPNMFTAQPAATQEVCLPPEFVAFPKMARLSRECVITEKIDGTNAQIFITDDGRLYAGSRTRWITPGKNDNFGFAAWAESNKEELLKLGPGRHFGEWWGSGIQRGYGYKDVARRFFSLFNTIRWCEAGTEPGRIATADPRIEKYQEVLPACCKLVPVLYRGIFTTGDAREALEQLTICGSFAAPGFMDPEGVVVFHVAAGIGFKKMLKSDESPKGAV